MECNSIRGFVEEDVIFTKIEEGYKQGGTRRRRMSATHSQFTPFRKPGSGQLDRDRAGVAAKNLGPLVVILVGGVNMMKRHKRTG